MNNLRKSGDHSNSLIKLTSKKFSEITSNIQKNSLESHVRKFLSRQKYDYSFETAINKLLANSLYENILVFTTKNIRDILLANYQENFTQKEIDVYNEFIDFDDQEKNEAIYNTFLKAVEFAILTSGRGIKELTKSIFKDKVYYLDTNVILRLIGVGGIERKEGLIQLIESCIHEGIVFKVSYSTEKELKNKIEERCESLRRIENKSTIETISEIIGQVGFNYDFETFYTSLIKSKKVNSINRFELFLKSKFDELKSKYNIEAESLASQLSEHQIKTLTEKLLIAKKSDFGVRYTKTAAKIDAINVLFVRKIRGNNNYNYKDIKSFYLTTDRTLNKVLATQNSKSIPETILPSQLYLLHNSNDSNKKELSHFVKFIKKRTTEFKLNGFEAIKYVEELRGVANTKEEISSLIRNYADTKYNSTCENLVRFCNPNSFREFAETHLETKLHGLEADNENYYLTLDKSKLFLKKRWKYSKITALFIEFIISLGIGIVLMIFDLKSAGIYTSVVLIIILGINHLIFRDGFKLHYKLSKLLFFQLFLKTSSTYDLLKNDKNFIHAINEVLKI